MELAYLMNNTQLYGCVREHAPDSIREAFQAIHAAYHYILHATVLQVSEHFQPEVGPLASGNVHAKQFLVPLFIDAKSLLSTKKGQG